MNPEIFYDSGLCTVRVLPSSFPESIYSVYSVVTQVLGSLSLLPANAGSIYLVPELGWTALRAIKKLFHTWNLDCHIWPPLQSILQLYLSHLHYYYSPLFLFVTGSLQWLKVCRMVVSTMHLLALQGLLLGSLQHHFFILFWGQGAIWFILLCKPLCGLLSVGK